MPFLLSFFLPSIFLLSSVLFVFQVDTQFINLLSIFMHTHTHTHVYTYFRKMYTLIAVASTCYPKFLISMYHIKKYIYIYNNSNKEEVEKEK